LLGPFEEEEEGTGVASDVVKVDGEDPATPGPLKRNDPGTVTIPPYQFKSNKATHTPRVSLACLCMRADFVRPANRVIEHKALCVCLSGPCFLCVLVYFCSMGDMLVGTNKRHPVSLRRGFLHARARTHGIRSAFLHACILCDLKEEHP